LVATIQITPYIQIQGIVARFLPNGLVAIEHGGREYIGAPLRRLRQFTQVSSAAV
jgi:hypothetical protein